MAKQALPPQVICELLGFDKEAVKAAFEAGKPPTATEQQLLDAVKQSVDPEVPPPISARQCLTRKHCVPTLSLL